ncbi:MAG: hypothetical protein ACREBR_05770 [bacterium]
MKEVSLQSYSAFKSLVTAKALLPQYNDTGNNYELFAIEQNISWQYTIVKDGGADQTDFETNYQSTCNKPLEIKAGVGRPVRVSASPQPAGTVEHWKGWQITVPAGQTSAYVDISFSSTVYLHGGYIVSSEVDYDDYVTADVLVAANNATYIGGLINNAYMIPNLPVSFESAESMSFPTSLKIRVTLNVGTASVTDLHANILTDYFI